MHKVRTSVIIKALLWNVFLAINSGTLISAFGAQVICSRIVGLTAGQRRICAAAPDAMAAVGHGIRMAKQECQQQFSDHRWNCTGPSKGNPFGHLKITASREAAYMYAVISAGVTYALMDACSRGNISICGCDAHYPSALDVATGPTASTWKWGGCSVDVGFGMGFARKFLDAQESQDIGDPRSLMNLHNNKVGRKIVKMLMNTDCKCHGVSGSCTMKTCWHSLPPFQEVGKALMRKYWKSRGVVPSTTPATGGNYRTMGKLLSKRLKMKLKLRSARSSAIVAVEEPKITELVYLEQSPNYCDRNFEVGSLGTYGRSCNRTSDGTDGCDLMCCGRGYNTHQYTTSTQCRCTFHWCCYVKCDTCVEHIEEYTCK